ncbi:MAG: hypothetical protein H0V44_14335 [Planctomycetes bacterium]|nr:hypothetical protein [Planctomycetota bacterium]
MSAATTSTSVSVNRKDIAILGRVIEELFRAASASTEGEEPRIAARRRLYLAAAKRLHERCATLEQQPRVAQRPIVETRRPGVVSSQRGSHPTPRMAVAADEDVTPVMGHPILA